MIVADFRIIMSHFQVVGILVIILFLQDITIMMVFLMVILLNVIVSVSIHKVKEGGSLLEKICHIL